MTIWIIAGVIYLLIGYDVAEGQGTSMRRKVYLVCLFLWPMELGFLIANAMKYLNLRIEHLRR